MKTMQLLTTTVLLLIASITSSSACGLGPFLLSDDRFEKKITEHRDRAEKGDLESLQQMVDLYTIYHHSAKTFEKAEYWLKKMENRTNSAEHQYALGSFYYHGIPIYGKASTHIADTKKALFWLGKAADQGHKDAKVLIKYIQGNQNETKAGA